MTKSRDPIVAIATPYGESAVGMLRLSGSDILKKIERFIRTKSREIKPRYAHFFTLLDEEGKPIDEGILIYYKAPSSYTGEDMVEMFLHGNPLILRRALEVFLKAGIRLAEPGEFTKRAFLNGKMDITQAEAVADLIGARTERARELALRQLRGELSNHINPLREKLLELIAYVEADIEFSEQDIPTLTKEQVILALEEIVSKIKELLSTVKTGEFIRKGMNLAIVGKPNVGKSSLFNALLGSERAIVSDVPGTTRDFLKEELHLEGIPINLIDTAGIRKTADRIESIGVERSIEKLKMSDLVLFVVDASKPLEREDWEIYNLVKEKEHICVLNKIDIGVELSVLEAFPEGIKVSAKTGEGIKELKKAMLDRVGIFGSEGGRVYLSLRHGELLRKALEVLEPLKEFLKLKDMSPEILALNLREAMNYLDEVIGVITTEEALGAIFSRFCIGK